MEKISKNLQAALYYITQNPTKSFTEVGKMFQTNRHAISKYLKEKKDFTKFTIVDASQQNLKDLYYFSAEELEGIEYYLANHEKTYNSIRKQFPCLPVEKESLKRQLEILGYETFIKEAKRYHYNKNAFELIKTEEDAYWLGFITADGCIVQNNRLAINLAQKDEEHLIKFCKYLSMPDNEIHDIIKHSTGGSYTQDNPISCLNICSVQLVKNLKDKNIFPAKSGKEIPYICESKELEKAYIRGLIDGDGYIRSTQSGMGIVGSFEICEYVQNFINDNIYDISKNHIRQHGTIWKLELSNQKATKEILYTLYNNATIFLDRKFKLFQDLYLTK